MMTAVSTTPSLAPKEAKVYQCPINFEDCGEFVSADFGDFSTTTVTVEACSHMKAQGYVSFTFKKSQALDILVSREALGYRHPDGLVFMTGGLC